MFLHGWKEIATYLHCGVRTVQRWEALGMPVSRIRVGDRGPVMAQTDDLDAWINQQSGKSKGRLRPDIEANVSRAASARASAMKELKILLQNELSVGLSLAQTALRNNNEKRSERNTAMARQAYERHYPSEPTPEAFGASVGAVRKRLNEAESHSASARRKAIV